MDQSLEALGLEYVDMQMVHWPYQGEQDEMTPTRLPMHQVWKEFESMHDQGKTRSLGVCNF